MSLKRSLKLAFLKVGALYHNSRDSRVLYYHDIHSAASFTDMSTSMELFEKHINSLREKGYKVVDEIKSQKDEVELTFDDGFRGLYENFDFFIKNCIPVKLFLVTDFIGKEGYLSKNEIEEMLQTKLLKVESHGTSHTNLDTLKKRDLVFELQGSKKRLEDLFGVEIEEICFPRGRFSEMVLTEARKAGYKKMYSSLPGPYHKRFRDGLIFRSLVQHADESEFNAILRGGDQIYFSRYLKMHYTEESPV